jgi:hypothetical protein
MATIGGPNNFGLFTNGDFRLGTNQNFTFGTINTSSQYDGIGCLQLVGGSGGASFSSDFVEVDTSQSYQMICYARTLQTGSNGSLAGGHIGFSCYDSKYRFIDLRNCGGIGNTTLSRNLNAGDSHVYLTSISGWESGNDVTNIDSFFRHVVLFPESHPEYNKPHQYSRIGSGDFNIYYKSAIQTDQGDWELKISNSSNNDMNMPNIGYSTPAGTPVCRGVAGGTYNYALGNPNYPLTWTKYSTAPFTGENRNSTTPFRFATKYIQFMILRNHNQRTAPSQNSFIYALDNIFFGKILPGIDYRNSL